MQDIANGWVWFGFSIFLIIALVIDAVAIKNSSRRTIKSAFRWTMIWIASALIFNALLWVYGYVAVDAAFAHEKALNFFMGYLIEKSLSIDNMFAFYMVFQHFKIPSHLQQRVFSYGIWSAIVLRLLLILAGTWLIARFHWVLYFMGVFLLLTGIKMFFVKSEEKDLAESWLFRNVRRFIRFTPELEGEHFFVKKNQYWYATPLLITLIFIELSDIIFAADSIPAIFAITQDPFIVWSSNIFAILGLRALYFILAGMADRFHLLKYGIALVLVFVGVKMLIEPWLHISTPLSLLVIVGILGSFTMMSIREERQWKR